eukprot:4036351-Amphidinium_carterae.1
MECVGCETHAETMNTDSDSHLDCDETVSWEEVDAAVRVASMSKTFGWSSATCHAGDVYPYVTRCTL